MRMETSLDRFVQFANSRSAQNFADVTLTLDSGEAFSCHRIVLAAHSPFLRQIFKDHLDDGDCVIFLPEFKSEDIRTLLAFCYQGTEISDEIVLTSLLSNLLRSKKEEEFADQILQEEEEELDMIAESRPKRKRKRKTFDEDEDDYLLLKDAKPGEKEEEEEEPTKPKKRIRNKNLDLGLPLKDLECCDKKFEDKIFYATHKEKVHSERPGENQFIICCDQKIFNQFKDHLQSTHQLDDKTDQAVCCDTIYADLDDLTKHCADNHGLRVATFKRLLCCATSLNNIDEYRRHKDDTHVECTQCWFISKDERHLDFHLYVKHKIGSKHLEKTALTCKFCSKIFKRVQLRQEHEDKHDDRLKYTCMFCTKQFKLLTQLRSHLYRMGKNHNPDSSEYNCDSCSKQFKTILAKRKHTRLSHENKTVLNCNNCEKSFVDRHSLDTHVKINHIKVKDVQCNQCGKLFATQERMKVHENFTHVVSDEKVPCDLCGKEYPNKNRMNDHRRSVHRSRKYQCEECGTFFKNTSTLKSHVVSVHYSHDEKPLQCSICLKGFLHESRLRAHEVIHNDEAQFSCRFCDRPNKCKNNNLKHEMRCKVGKAKVVKEEIATFVNSVK